MVINYEKSKKLGESFRAINHPLRISMIELIDQAGEVNVAPLCKTLNLKQAIASRHLSILKNARFVQAHREGSRIYYSLNYENFEKFSDTVKQIMSR